MSCSSLVAGILVMLMINSLSAMRIPRQTEESSGEGPLADGSLSGRGKWEVFGEPIDGNEVFDVQDSDGNFKGPDSGKGGTPVEEVPLDYGFKEPSDLDYGVADGGVPFHDDEEKSTDKDKEFHDDKRPMDEDANRDEEKTETASHEPSDESSEDEEKEQPKDEDEEKDGDEKDDGGNENHDSDEQDAEEGVDKSPEENDKDIDSVDTSMDNHTEEIVPEDGAIFDTPFFSLKQVTKYFRQLEEALEKVFRQETAHLNGTSVNSTEKEIEVDGHRYIVKTSILRSGDGNSSFHMDISMHDLDSNRTRRAASCRV